MAGIVVRRLAISIPVVLIVTFAVFSLLLLVPGDPAVALAGENPTPERVTEIRDSLDLDDPFVVQYGRWLGRLVTKGDLGTSLYSGQSVASAIGSRFGVTLSLTLVTLVFATALGVTGGTIAGRRPNSRLSKGIGFLASIGVGAPHFWIGLVLIQLFAIRWGLLPALQYVPLRDNPAEWLRHLLLPAVALGLAPAAEIARQARGAVRDVAQSDYIRTAVAKGLSPRKILFKHTLKNAAIPVVTVVGLQAGRLVGGAVIIEQLFALPGLGSLSIQAVLERDLPMIQGVVLITALLVLATNLLVDLSYCYFNPKVRQS